MSENQAHYEVKLPSERSFGVLFAAIFTALTLWVFYKSNEIHTVLAAVAAVLWLISIAKPSLLRPLNLLWFKFGMLLSAIVSPLVMGVIFFCVVTPMGVICRLIGKDLLRTKLDPSASSYWIVRDKKDKSESSMKNQF